MSLYSIPGFLFPPIDAGAGLTTNISGSSISEDSNRGAWPLNQGKETNEGVMEGDGAETTTGEVKRSSREDWIAVREAKIDPARLVQSLTRVRGKNNNKECTLHEEAIQFELSINFGGRSYQATRTLRRIIQLRNDLIRELDHHRKILMRRKRLIDQDDLFDVTIPELPCISDKGGPATVTTCFAGRGFTMVHALLRSYCPAMERWLLNVTSIISPNNSPTLTKFLWEPLSSSDTMTPILCLSHSRCGLDSIQEIEHDDDGAEDNDETTLQDCMCCPQPAVRNSLTRPVHSAGLPAFKNQRVFLAKAA